MMLMLRRKTFHQPFFCHEFVQALNKSIANGVTMESETATLPKHRCSPLVCVAQYSDFCIVFCRLVFVFFFKPLIEGLMITMVSSTFALAHKKCGNI
jgi:hypothetical protein